MSPCIDVIIPIHNQSRISIDCLNSIAACANETQYELIVVDDASTESQIKEFLSINSKERKITLITNQANLGFTKSVNLAMKIHPQRDVLLLNSDTLVFGNWIDRLRRVAYSQDRVATVNPLTNSSHISSYPYHGFLYGPTFEIGDDILDALAAEANANLVSVVHTTVGFCMYIQRAALNDIGLFDEKHFPYAYGEESDFCYRARKVGWRHLVTGDVFVRHLEGQSFGERRKRLVEEASAIFGMLHPDYTGLDEAFARRDPNRRMRSNLDLARLKCLLGGRTELSCYYDVDPPEAQEDMPALYIHRPDGTSRFIFRNETFPNLPRYRLPSQMVEFNRMLKHLGITTLRVGAQTGADSLTEAMRGQPFETGLEAHVSA